MKAMVLAAGLGTRLRPLTDAMPKALVPFKGVPMVERIIRNLAGAGVDYIVVNVHHLAEQVCAFLDKLYIPGVHLHISDESGRLMDTGGAILQAADHFSDVDAFLVHNVDVVTNLEINSLIEAHRLGDSLVTLAVKKRPTSRSLLFNREGLLAGWRHNETGEERIIRSRAGEGGRGLEEYGNSCVQVISRDFLDHFPAVRPVNLTRMYLDLAERHEIKAFVHNGDYWYDLGRYENFLKADKEVF